MMTENFSKIVSIGKTGFRCNLFYTLSGIQKQNHRFADKKMCLFPLRRPAAETELPASEPDPGFHILRSDLPSKNYLFYPVCLLVLHYALYYTFLIRKKQAIAAAKSSL